MTHSVTLPRRTLAVVCVYNNLVPNQSGYIYEVKPSSTLYEKYPNICVIPMIHNVDVHKTENVHLVQSLDISEIMAETSTEPSPIIFEDDDKEVLNKQERNSNK